jgi:arsenite/tail-anchored protein-transporting ATPase
MGTPHVISRSASGTWGTPEPGTVLNVPRFTYFIGKGGVGKTTVSSAYAVHLAGAMPRKPVLLISTDPAHSLGDVLETELSNSAKRIKSPGRLYAREIDAAEEMAKFIGAEREALLKVIESGTFFEREEIEPLLEASLPGTSEIAALLSIHELLEQDEFEEIVVDTAPMGHTLRMFDVPQHLAKFVGFLETAGSRDQAIAQQFAHKRMVEPTIVTRWRAMVARVRDALAGEQSRVVLVTSPETFSLQESWRATEDLEALGIAVDTVVLNRMVVRDGGECGRCRRRAVQGKRALKEIEERFVRESICVGEDPGGPVVGVEALGSFGEHVFEGKRLRVRLNPPKTAEVKLVKAEWPALETPLTLTLGKGGVGKTTISAGLCVAERRRNPGTAVSICSIDPAPSLDDVFATEVDDEPRVVLGDPKLRATEFDAVAAFKNWAERIKERVDQGLSQERGGLHIDLSFDRRIIVALLDVTPPGVDEIFAVFRIRELAKGDAKVVVDMAPTGHALEVLVTPARMLVWSRLLLKTLSAHRTLTLAQDAAVEIATVSQQVREFSAEITDAKRTRAWPVMLAEPLPDRETGRLLRGLSGLGSPTEGLFVNRLLFAADTKGCVRCERARRWQMSTLAGLKLRYKDSDIYCVREFPREVAGKSALEKFTRELWQIK